jgi:murein L,D-transpeptidase YafK
MSQAEASKMSYMTSKVASVVLLSGLMSAQLFAGTDTSLPPPIVADKVIVMKGERTLRLMKGESVLKSYRISLGTNPIGAKQQQGDHKTPEGRYVLDRHNEKSQFHRSIHISYPNDADRARARKLGVSPGGDIFLHGLPNGYQSSAGELREDWTDGCIAVTNAEIDEIFRAVPDGTPIEIRP